MTDNMEQRPYKEEAESVPSADENVAMKSFGKRMLNAGAEVFVAGLIYLLVSIAMTWPMIIHPQEVILGGVSLEVSVMAAVVSI